MDAVQKFGDDLVIWKAVAQQLGEGVTDVQCRNRYVRYLKPSSVPRKIGSWSEEEVCCTQSALFMPCSARCLNCGVLYFAFVFYSLLRMMVVLIMMTMVMVS